MSLLEKMYDFYDSNRTALIKRDEFAGELISKLDDEFKMLNDGFQDEILQLINDGYGYLEEEDNNLQHISRDLWKGFVLGFISGHYEARTHYETDFEYFDPDFDDEDDCIIVNEADITNISVILENAHGITVRLLPPKEYEEYLKRNQPESDT